MNHVPLAALGWLIASAPWAQSQALISGRLLGERFPGSRDLIPFSAILCFDSLAGPGGEARGFRTWETEPPGWFRFSTDAGNHTLVFTGPNHFFRPIVLNNVFVRPGEKYDRLRPGARFDFANFFEGEWDPKPARAYFQTFVAHGTSVTAVGFRLASDGVDGAGPKSQNLLASVHRRGPGTPDTWPQVGPTAAILDVDSGGPKNYLWCAGWDSGQVPLTSGETYAVQLRAERDGGTFQTFWRRDDDRTADCYRVGATNTGWQGHDLWLAVSTDGDGLVIPYNKRIEKQFGPFAGFASRWSQTYVAQGRSLASVVLYAAVGGAQPPLTRQRVAVRVRRGGADGATCGIEKIAIGSGNYTGDASWGAFGVAFAPGEVPLTPGETYAVEFESLENAETIGGFVNIKAQASDGRAGFNPYRKFAPDSYDRGTAYKGGTETMPFDLDLQIIEYESSATNWPFATQPANLLANGSMEEFVVAPAAELELPAPPRGVSGYLPTGRGVGRAPTAWRTFTLDPATRFAVFAEAPPSTNHFARVFATGGQTTDGGFVQRLESLSAAETYRLNGCLRSSWPVDFEHQCLVGLDPTGQETDAKAPSIIWTTLPPRHGVFVDFTSEPVRPATNAISVWLRARSTSKSDTFAPFTADFDDLALRRVRTSPPR